MGVMKIIPVIGGAEVREDIAIKLYSCVYKSDIYLA
jgi:hypothetical protein